MAQVLWGFCIAFMFVSCSGGDSGGGGAGTVSQDGNSRRMENSQTPNNRPAGARSNAERANLTVEQKVEAMNDFKASMENRFKTKFKVISTKDFYIAYICSKRSINWLKMYLDEFYRQVYPKYFVKQVEKPWKIVYFANKTQFTAKTGSEAYGYYSPRDRTLYTYCNSGHGTLWHEMMHGFMDSNTDRDIHQWFSEGLASFYEMAFLRGGKVSEGWTNWRMPALKEAIKSGQFTHIKEFMMDEEMKESFGYAEARFLFCYMWMKNIIVPFVKGYFYDLLPKYSGNKLGKETIKLLEGLAGKSIDKINDEYLYYAKRLKRDQKLRRLR
ncbi:MAG: hypothetical protein OEZ36_10695 [Spirochaetota bacterium]|nr:hypothetical protein [Spirochaetota bacterium]